MTETTTPPTAEQLCRLRREVLDGYSLKFDRPTGSKEARAYGVASAAEQGLIDIVAGPHTTEFLD